MQFKNIDKAKDEDVLMACLYVYMYMYIYNVVTECGSYLHEWPVHQSSLKCKKYLDCQP